MSGSVPPHFPQLYMYTTAVLPEHTQNDTSHWLQLCNIVLHDTSYTNVGFRELAEKMLTVYFKWGHGFLSLNRCV